MNNQLKILEKEFNNEKIRTVWDKEQEKYFISVVDIVAVLTESDNPRNYRKVLKHRLKQEGNESVTSYNQLKLNLLMVNTIIKTLSILRECLD